MGYFQGYFRAVFGLFPLTVQKIKIFKKWKKKLKISLFYTSVPKIMITWCTVPEIWCATDRWPDRWTEKVNISRWVPHIKIHDIYFIKYGRSEYNRILRIHLNMPEYAGICMSMHKYTWRAFVNVPNVYLNAWLLISMKVIVWRNMRLFSWKDKIWFSYSSWKYLICLFDFQIKRVYHLICKLVQVLSTLMEMSNAIISIIYKWSKFKSVQTIASTKRPLV